MDRVVTFVCLHGAGKSRVAAALFNVDPPEGWRAESAGLEPQAAASPHAAALLVGDPAAGQLDVSTPRALPARSDLVVGIDCAVPGSQRWDLEDEWPAASVVGQLRAMTAELAAQLRKGSRGG